MPSEREKKLLEATANQRQFATMEEFRFDSLQAGYWDIITGFFYKEPRSVNALIPLEYWPMKPGIDKDGNPKDTVVKPASFMANVSNGLLVETATWWPGMPRLIEGWLAVEGAMIRDPRRIMFNIYRPPPPLPKLKGKLAESNMWVEHVKKLWPTPAEHNYFFDYCAHMVQKPEEKCNSIVTLSGKQGIGKDMALTPVKAAVGQWNVRDISPDEFATPYNPWIECVMLVINEMRPTKEDFHASSIYEKLKKISVTPPDTLALSDKYLKTRYIANVLRIFITTNNMTSMYIDNDDRRMGAILHSTLPKQWAPPNYFATLANWLEKEGNAVVAAWLGSRDIKAFDPKKKAEPTAGWNAIVSGWQAPSDAITQALEALREPEVFFSIELLRQTFDGADELRGALKHPRKLQHRLQLSGYFMKSFESPWEFKGERPFKTKLAFVKNELMHEETRYMDLLRARGELLASQVAILSQTLPQQKIPGTF